MFNRKKIKALKENLKMVNDQRLQLRNENLIYQKELVFLRDLVKENNEMLKKLIGKKTKKNIQKEFSKIAMKNIDKAAKELDKKRKEIENNER